MDIELVAWMAIFVGGYSLVVGWLLRVAMRPRNGTGEAPPE